MQQREHDGRSARLDNAREQGAEVWEEANVTDVHLEPSETDDLPRATGVTVLRAGQPPEISGEGCARRRSA